MATGAITEEVAEHLEEAAEITRQIDTKSIGFFLGGVGVGFAVGFFFGYRFNREKIKAEAFKKSEEEVEKIRELYQVRASVARDKPTVAEIIEQRGYSTIVSEDERPLKAPVPMSVREASPGVTHEHVKSKDDNWSYPKELEQRDPTHPYVIHQDEYKENEREYEQVTYTYYAQDDVLTDSDDKPLPHSDIVVGQDNLKWGHGADDLDVVFVRNDKLELDMEICRSHGSYEQEVMGLEHSDTRDDRRRRHSRFDQDDRN